MLMSPNKDETAVHGCHCQGDMAVRMRKVLQTAGLVFECFTCVHQKINMSSKLEKCLRRFNPQNKELTLELICIVWNTNEVLLSVVLFHVEIFLHCFSFDRE